MTKVDEGAAVPRIGAAERGKLSRALDREHVVAGTLFGSQATGKAGPLSDVDIAVWLDPDLPHEKLSELRAELTLAAIEALGTDEVDLVVLNGAPPLLRHQALRAGTRLIDRDPRARPAGDRRAARLSRHRAPTRDAGRRAPPPHQGRPLWSTLSGSAAASSADEPVIPPAWNYR